MSPEEYELSRFVSMLEIVVEQIKKLKENQMIYFHVLLLFPFGIAMLMHWFFD